MMYRTARQSRHASDSTFTAQALPFSLFVSCSLPFVALALDFASASARLLPVASLTPCEARSRIDSESSPVNSRRRGTCFCLDRGRALFASAARNCASLAGRFVPDFARSFLGRFVVSPSGDKSRLRFDCVEVLLAEGVMDRVDVKGGEEGTLDIGDDRRSLEGIFSTCCECHHLVYARNKGRILLTCGCRFCHINLHIIKGPQKWVHF
jgi:hypothetical protein